MRHFWVSIATICLFTPLAALTGCTPTAGNSNPSVTDGATTSAATQPATPVASPESPLVSDSPAGQKRLRIVTTFLPIYLFTRAVAGAQADVSILIPPGSEVHDYQARPADVKAIAQADVLIKNGLGMEKFLDATIQNAGNSKLVVIDSSQGVKTVSPISPIVHPDGSEVKMADHDHDHHHDHTSEAKGVHIHAGTNPHIWLDPVLAQQQVANIRDHLIKVDPAHQTTYAANAASYIKQLEALDQEFRQTLQSFPERTFITFHDAFPYLAQRYNLKQVAVVALPEDSLTPQAVKQTVETVKKYRVKALFSEPGIDNKLLDSLAKDLNLKLQTLDSLESGQQDPQYYFQVMRANLAALKAAFQ